MVKIRSEGRLTKIKSISKKKRFLFLAFILFIFSWFYFSEEDPILVLDKKVLRSVSSEIPDSRIDALSVSREIIINYTNISEKLFDDYFALSNASKTQYRWIITYNVRENPDLTVFLVKRISQDEGFEITDKFIADNVGFEYFKEHFKRKSFDGYAAHYSYTAPPYNSVDMWVRLGDERNILKHHVLLISQEIKIGKEKVQQICKDYGIPEPASTLVLVKGRINCRCTWQHQPTDEDYAQQRVYGIDIDATTGEILRTHKYIKPSSKPIQKSQIDTLAQKVSAFNELEDGAVINVRISKSFSEGFTITKSFGRLIVKDGLSDDPDITMWMDRNSYFTAVESTDPMSTLIEESKAGHVTVTPEKNLIVLSGKGYTTLYEEFKKE